MQTLGSLRDKTDKTFSSSVQQEATKPSNAPRNDTFATTTNRNMNVDLIIIYYYLLHTTWVFKFAKDYISKSFVSD